MELITFLYFVAGFLYLVTGIKSLLLDRNNKVNISFLIMTGCLFIQVFCILVDNIIIDNGSLLLLHQLKKIASFIFYAVLLYFIIVVNSKTKDKEIWVWIINFIFVIGEIYLYFTRLKANSYILDIINNQHIYEWYNHGEIYPWYFGVHIILTIVVMIGSLCLWTLNYKKRKEILKAYMITLALITLLVVGSYFVFKEQFYDISDSKNISVLVFSAMVLLFYYLIIKNSFFEKNVSISMMKVFEMIQEGFLIVSNDYIINKANEVAEEITGYTFSRLYGMNAKRLFDNIHSGDTTLNCANGDKRFVNISEASINDSNKNIKFRIISFRDIEYMKQLEKKLVSLNEDLEKRVDKRKKKLYEIQKNLEQEITKKKKSEEVLKKLVCYDILTDLPNRFLFNQILENVIATGYENIAILVIDIDNFKRINDTIGHNQGDKILRQLADYFKGYVKEGEVAGRMDSDEFVVLLHQINSEKDLQNRVKEIQQNVKQIVYFKNSKIYLTCSMGGVILTSDSSAKDMLYNASVALYGAKTKGTGAFELYSKTGINYLKEKIKIRSEIEQAFRNDEFELYYQPQVLVSNGKIHGTEALIRWNHQTKGLIMPSSFIPQIENDNLIVELGEWVLDKACRQIKEWSKNGKSQFLPVAVNLSMRHFETENVINYIIEIIHKYDIDPADLKVEITESFLSEEHYIIEKNIKKVSEANISLSLDDFGTGYSSFHYIKHIEADYLKIPREYVVGIGKNKKTEYIVKSIVELAHSLNMIVIAEGVETEEQRRFLSKFFCDMIQGNYYYEPMKTRDLEKII